MLKIHFQRSKTFDFMMNQEKAVIIKILNLKKVLCTRKMKVIFHKQSCGAVGVINEASV